MAEGEIAIASKRKAAACVRVRWYAVQVLAGHESAAVEAIYRAVSEYANERGIECQQVLQECFSPKYATAKYVGGGYVPTQGRLLPGYLIAITRSIDELSQAIRKASTLTKILGNEDAFIPLADHEVGWLQAFTQKGERIVAMSEGFKEGGRVVVTSGPLVGYEAQITKINRRKKTALVKLHMLGRQVEVQLGFNLVKKSI